MRCGGAATTAVTATASVAAAARAAPAADRLNQGQVAPAASAASVLSKKRRLMQVLTDFAPAVAQSIKESIIVPLMHAQVFKVGAGL